MTAFYIVMGVAGCGKSTIGGLLGEKLGIPFFDGDDFHPQANVDKMKQGIALTDEDRKAFIGAINSKMHDLKSQHQQAVFACSALKELYRDWLSEGLEGEVQIIYLQGSQELISKRMQERKDHFMPLSLLESQFATLEEPHNAWVYSIENSPLEIVKNIVVQTQKAEFGLVGLGVMGTSLARNLASKGVKMALYNRRVEGFEERIAEKRISEFDELSQSSGYENLESFVVGLQTPRKIFLMIKAGEETDKFLDILTPLLQKNDIVIDGGNSHFEDTERRILQLSKMGLSFVGTGVSGGEKGALEGPSIMPSGSLEAIKIILPFFEKITATDYQGGVCTTSIGEGGSGHFVKMVHNGIEYAEMQLIAEVYAIFRHHFKYRLEDIASIFEEWNSGALRSYLLEISAKILRKKVDGKPILDSILDKAGNKGTGNWTSILSLQMGEPTTLITSALFARFISTIKQHGEVIYPTVEVSSIDQKAVKSLENAYLLARILNHDQGFRLIDTTSKSKNWNINLPEIARIWTNGCIIRGELMEKYAELPKDSFRLIHEVSLFEEIGNLKEDLKKVVVMATESEIPIPCLSSAFNFILGMQNHVPTAQMIQAQRDFFGAHTYQKRGDNSGQCYHTVWE
ncbi:MAG: NADP-dependent phosphogluconate dehydrogenase [Leadbetterella sp.]